MIEIRLLEQLTAFAEHGTLSTAAEKIHASQPTLTRSMKQLEDQLGVPLFVRSKKYLLQIEESSFTEIAANSDYPMFSSSYFISRGETLPGRVNVAIVDEECHTNYYLVCLNSEKKKYERLFRRINESTIK